MTTEATIPLPPVLANWYQADNLDEIGGTDRIRRDIERWERVEGNPDRFPLADLVGISRFLEAAYPFLAPTASSPDLAISTFVENQAA